MEEYYDGVVAKPELDELYHHGILGMHWGKRNGPPYPLGSDVSTGKRLKSGAAGKIIKKNPKKKALKDSYDYKSKKTVSEREKTLDNIYVKDPKTGKRGDGSTIAPDSKKREKMDAELKKLSNKDFDGEKARPIINTNKSVIDNAVDAALKERQEKIDKVANSNQDMFNDLLDRAYPDGDPEGKQGHGLKGQSWGPRGDRAEALKEYHTELKRVAKENGVHKGDLENKILESYEKRVDEISKLDAQRQEQKRAQEKKETINRRLQNAKTRDQWDLMFLEATQNAPWEEASTLGEISDSAYKAKMLQEYKKYLEDPEKYWNTRSW